MIRGGAIAQRYARALFGLGQERGDLPGLLRELDTLTDLALGDDELRRVLFTPIHPRSERGSVLGELVERLELSKEVHAFSMLLVDQNRTGYLPQIRDALISKQQANGAWHRGKMGTTSYETPMAIIILATPHRYIPIYQR